MKDSDPKTPHQPAPHARHGSGATKRRTGPIIAIVVAVVVLGFLIFGKSSKTKGGRPAPPPVPVSVAQVREGSIDIYLDALGTVTPVYTVTITSRVAGELKEVRYQEGQMVKKGDLLALIDPRPYEALVLQAQGQLARDQAMLKNAQLDMGRYQNAYSQHAIPEQQLATQQALVQQDSGVVKVDQGNLDAAQVNLDYTRIVAPIDGRVGLRSIDPGNIVTANGTTGLATITQLQPITVIFNLPEDDLGQVAEQIALGRTLRVEALDRTQQRQLAHGTLITVDNQINPTTGTIRARAIFPNTHSELFPNQFVNARLLVKTLEKVDLVPTAAIQRNNDAAFVYVVQADNTILSRNVKVATTESEVSAVTGLKAGDKVVTDGFDKLQAGSRIVVRKATAASAPAPKAE